MQERNCRLDQPLVKELLRADGAQPELFPDFMAGEILALVEQTNSTPERVAATATFVFATRSASRNTPTSENAAKTSIAVRVTSGAYPTTFHQNASQAITRGGCAFETVE